MENKNREEHLKHLKFLLSSAKLSSECLSKLCEYLKKHSGILGPIVVPLGSGFSALVGPSYKEHKCLYNLLTFADGQVENVTIIIDQHGPHFGKEILSIVQWGFDTIAELCDEIRIEGIRGVKIYAEKKLESYVIELLHKLGVIPELTGVHAGARKDGSTTSSQSAGGDTTTKEPKFETGSKLVGGDIPVKEDESKISPQSAGSDPIIENQKSKTSTKSTGGVIPAKEHESTTQSSGSDPTTKQKPTTGSKSIGGVIPVGIGPESTRVDATSEEDNPQSSKPTVGDATAEKDESKSSTQSAGGDIVAGIGPESTGVDATSGEDNPQSSKPTVSDTTVGKDECETSSQSIGGDVVAGIGPESIGVNTTSGEDNPN